MPLFILLSTLTQQGVQTLKSNPERLRQVNEDIAELGCKVLHQWATLGEFDFVNVVEAPDIATVAKVSVALGERGSTRLEPPPELLRRTPPLQKTIWEEVDGIISIWSPEDAREGSDLSEERQAAL